MNKLKYQVEDSNVIFAIYDSLEKGYWHVELMAVSDMEFDIKIKDCDKTLKDLCWIAPKLAIVDTDIVEAFDDDLITKFRQSKKLRKLTLIVDQVNSFVKNNDFVNVYCAPFQYLGYGNTISRQVEKDTSVAESEEYSPYRDYYSELESKLKDLGRRSPKYEIGDRLQYEDKDIGLIIRGVMPTSFGFRYFIQVDNSNNSFSINDHEMDEMIERCAIDVNDY